LSSLHAIHPTRRQALTLFAGSCGLAFASHKILATESEVDLALVLAIDCSSSVDAGEYALQMQGMAKAIQDPKVMEAIKKGPNQKIALSAFHWSDENSQQKILPWIAIASEADAARVGKILAAVPRKLTGGGTSISGALLYAQSLFQDAPKTSRKVIDLSTDGRNNVGLRANIVRSRLVAAGLTINALAIINEWETLNVYLENQIIGGQGSFVIKASNYEGYADAILKKLIREIVGPGIS
jgi:Protein of unknown function (DUF1194)